VLSDVTVLMDDQGKGGRAFKKKKKLAGRQSARTVGRMPYTLVVASSFFKGNLLKDASKCVRCRSGRFLILYGGGGRGLGMERAFTLWSAGGENGGGGGWGWVGRPVLGGGGGVWAGSRRAPDLHSP